MVPANSDRILRVPPYSGYHCSTPTLPVRGCHPLRRIFPDTSCSVSASLCGPMTPPLPQQSRFGLFPFRSPLLWESIFLSLPPGTKMFQFPGFARINACQLFKLTGFPIRTSADQLVFANPRGFSQLTTSFVAYRSQGILRSLFVPSS